MKVITSTGQTKITGQQGQSGYSGASGFSGLGLSGLSGYSGLSGVSGFTGQSGESGSSGSSGSSGFTGQSGSSGFTGQSGTSGASGYSGFSGSVGVSGFSGQSGTSGQSGLSGQSGTSGVSGFTGQSGTSGTSGTSGYSGQRGSINNDNLLLNPQMDWWQLYATPTTLTSQANGTYAADQWYVLSQTAAIQTAQVAGPTGTQAGLNAFRIKQTQASAQRCGIIQWIEGTTSMALRGHTVSLNFQVQNSAGQAVRYAVIEWSNTLDNITKNPVNDWTSSTYTAGNFFTSPNTNVDGVGSTTPSANTWTNVSLTNLGITQSCNNLAVFIWSEGTMATNATMDITCVQATQTSFAPTYQPPKPALDLLACQRFLWVSQCGTQVVGFGQVATTADIDFIICLPTVMRTTPSLLSNGSTTFNGNDGSSNAQSNAVFFDAVTSNLARFSITQSGTSWTAGRAAIVFGHAGSSYLGLTAQL